MARRKRKERPIPAAAGAVEIAGYRAAELIDDFRDLLSDYRDWGKVPVNFRAGGLMGKLLGDESGLDILLPPDEPEPAEEPNL